jgi:hypothetical protein
MSDTATSDNQVMDHRSKCLDFVGTWLERPLTSGEVTLANSALDYAFHGDSIDYDSTTGAFKPGKHNDLTAEDKDVLNWVFAYLRSSVQGAKESNTNIGMRVKKIQTASESPNYKVN